MRLPLESPKKHRVLEVMRVRRKIREIYHLNLSTFLRLDDYDLILVACHIGLC